MAHLFKSDRWEQFCFKRTAAGWIFQSPTFWPFGLGPRRHYLLSDTQKAEVATILGHAGHADWRALPGLLVALLPGMLPLLALPWMIHDPLVASTIGALLAGLWLSVVLNIYYWRLLRSILAEARPTSERITFIDRLNAFAQFTPLTIQVLGLLWFATSFALSVYLLWKTWTIGSLLGMVLMGGAALYVCAMLTVKLRSRHWAV